MDCPFQVGDEVVCVRIESQIDDHYIDPSIPCPAIGEVCRVRSIIVVPPGWLDTGEVCLRLHGYIVESMDPGVEGGFPSYWFERVVKTDISELQKLVAPYSKKKELEPA